MENNLKERTKKYPKGHFVGMWMGIGIAIFSGLGIPLSIIVGNYGLIAIGPGIGVAVGLTIGQAIENKYDKEGRIRPLTDVEKRRQRIAVVIGLGLLLLGALVFTLLYLRN